MGSQQVTHRSLQIKGQVIALELAGESDRAALVAYLDKFSEILAFIGIPRDVSMRLNNWPAWAVRVRIDELYEQTPGPGAGAPFKGSWS
jgi:hypothetical protein